jgi:hypothetical protein
LQLNDHGAQLALHLSENACFFFDTRELLLANSNDGREFFGAAHALGGAICDRGVQLKQFPEFGQRESHGLAPLDESQAFEIRWGVDSIAGCGPLRRAQEAATFVEANGLDADAGGFCELANAHGVGRPFIESFPCCERGAMQASLRRIDKPVKQAGPSKVLVRDPIAKARPLMDGSDDVPWEGS